jgi:phage baseplate assembly protein W
MPVERVSRGFKDLSMTFQSNPLNSDLIGLKNANAIARSVRNIVMTSPGEKFFQPKLLFENVDDITASQIQEEIEFSITNYEPRVSLKNVQINADNDNASFDATITYSIIGADVAPQQLQFALQSTR